MSWISLSSQTVEHLVKIHKASNSSISPQMVKMMGNHVYTFIGMESKDTIFIDGKPQDSLVSSAGGYGVAIAKFDADHRLLNTGILTSLSVGFRNVFVHNDKIYLFVQCSGKELKYKGKTVWQSQNPIDWYRKYGMLIFDADLRLLDSKWIDQNESGFDGIAFAEDRMYLFGKLTNSEIDANPDTFYVDGHALISVFGNRGLCTRFMLTYDTNKSEVINEFIIHSDDWSLSDRTVSTKVAPDGTVYFLTNTSGGYWYQKEVIPTSVYRNNSFLFVFDQDGNLKNWANFALPNQGNSVQLSSMELSSEGHIILYGLVQGSIGINGVEMIRSHLPETAVLMALDGDDLSLRWYDYMASEKTATGLTIRVGGMTIDNEDNIYIMNSNGINLLAEDRDGSTLRPGNHIYKYNKDGKRLGDFGSFAQFGEQFLLSAKGVDTLLIMKGVGLTKGSYDSLLNITNTYGREFALFQFILNKTSSLDDVLEQKNILAFPNPINKDGLLTISSENSVFKKTFVIMDAIGRIKGKGILDDTGQIHLSSFHLRSGIYFIQLLDGMTQPFKLVIVG